MYAVNGIVSLAISGGLMVGMFAAVEVGRRIGRRRLAEIGESARVGTGPVEGAVFGLLGLLLAFTFSGAASRFDTRRQQVLEEANAIGTAWLRLDLAPSDAQPPLRDLFRRYVDSRLEAYRRLPDIEAARAVIAQSLGLQTEIWQAATAAAGRSATPATATLLLPALNTMFDIVTTRTQATQTHPPTVIYVLLFALSLICAMLAGHAMAGARRRNWLHTAGFAVVMALSVYVILDLEYPRLGLIRIDAVDQLLVDVRQTMG